MVLITSETQFSKTGIEVTYTDSTSGETSKQQITFDNKVLNLDSGINVTAGNAYFGENVATHGNLSITGTTNLGSTLAVTGASQLNNTLTVTGASNLNNTLQVTGATTLGNTVAITGATSMASTMDVTGASHLHNTLSVDGASTLGSTLAVTGATSLNNTLDVVGAAHLESSLQVDGNITLGGTLSATGAITIDSSMNVKGSSHLENTLLVDGATTVGASLGVTGATTLSNTLGVTGATSLGNTLEVTGATTLNNTLAVTGNATFQNNMTVNGNLTVLGNTTSLNTTTLEIKDTAIILADGNTADVMPIGIQAQYKPANSASVLYAGVKRRAQTGEFVFFKDSATVIEESINANDIYANVLANSFSCASDANLKENIKEVDEALDKVQRMRGVYYTWIDKNQPQTQQLGVIAQEVQAVCPELVEKGGNGYLSVDYPKLTAVLIQAVKELKAKVDAMESQRGGKRSNRTRKHRGEQKTKRASRK